MNKTMWVLAVLLTGLAQPPRRDTPVVPTPMGTASVSGRVLLGDTAGTPVRRAVVTLLSTDGVDPRSAITDNEGRFTVGGLPGGRYTLTAKKPAHLTSAYGSRRPGRAGTTLVVAAGQHLDQLEWTLPRGGVLAGRVTMPNGEPAPNTIVMAIPQHLASIGGVLSSSEVSFQTDDRGAFRIYGLPADRYLLMVVPAFGRGEIARRSDADYEEAIQKLRQPVIAAPGASTASTAEPRPTEAAVGFAPVYYPGTTTQSDATWLTVAPGDVKDGLDFPVSTVPISTIRGTIVDANGAPVQAATISVDMVGPALPISAGMSARANRPNARGEFTISNAAPGRYHVRARAGGVTMGAGGSLSISNEAQVNWAYAELTVTGANIDAFRLTLQPGLTFSGRMATTGAPDAPTSWKGSSVTVQPVAAQGTVLNGLGLPQGSASRSGTVAEDGAFVVQGLEPGDYEVRLTLSPGISGRWSLASIQHEGRDLRDAPITFQSGSVTGAEVVLTSQPAELSGRFTSESGAPATDYFIVAFPADRTLWHPASPRVRVMRPAADGLFSTRDLPPGTYRLAALTDVEPDEHRRPEFLESIYESAISVTVTAGTTTKQDVRIR
jgi:Carboxypeptidase regulatory-like domain